MMNLREDTEELDDFIRLGFADVRASENLELLDPGIIDLECDSEEESTSSEEPETFHAQPDLHSQPVITSHSNVVDLKPMCIKVVDCYKFPWYFDKFKDIIEHKLAINNIVEVDDEVLDENSTDSLKEVFANMHFADMSAVDSVTMQHQAYDCRKEVSKLTKEIDVIAAKELLENKKPILGPKNAKNYVRNYKMDFDIRRAMEQRKNSVVDLKRNIGLVGMKILRLPNKPPSELPIDISKQLIKPMETNTEKGQENKQEKGPTSSSHVKVLDNVLTDVTSTTPVCEIKVEGMKNSISTQKITENSSPKPFIRSISALEETKTISDVTSLELRHNVENKFSLELSVNKIAEEIYRLVRPHEHAGNFNQTIIPNSPNTMTTPTKVNAEKNIKRFKYPSKNIQKYIAEGTRTTKMIEPLPISPKNRNKIRINSNFQSKTSEIIDITGDKMDIAKSSTEAKIVRNKILENIKDHKGKEISSKDKPSTCIAKPKIVLSTKTPNKLTETIIKIKEMQQKESSLPTKSQNQSNNTTSSTLSKSLSENRILIKQIDIIPHNKNVGTPEQLLKGNDETKIIKSSSTRISIAELQYPNRNDLGNGLGMGNPQNTPKNKVSTDLNAFVKTQHTTEKEAEKVSENNHPKSAQVINESPVTVKLDDSSTTSKNKSSLDSSPKKKTKEHHDTNQFPAVNSIENASIVKTITSCTKFDTVSNHNFNVSDPAVILNTTTQNNQTPEMPEPTVYNSMQAHTLYKPPESSYQTFRQSQYDAVRFPSHIPQVNQPISSHSLQNSTHYPGESLPFMDSRPPSSIENDNILPLMSQIHGFPMPPIQPTTFGVPMLNGIGPNMLTRMTHPGPNGGFRAQLPSNPRPMSPFGVLSQISRPQGVVSSQTPMNYPQTSISEMQSYEMLWSGPFSHIPLPPPPPPPPPYQPGSQDISTGLPKSVKSPQSMDSSIIGRNINGIVKKINITAPFIEQNEETGGKNGIIEIENLERDASTPLYDEIPTDCLRNTEPVYTKMEMLRILDTGLQRADSDFDVVIPAEGIQIQAYQHATIDSRPHSRKENLLSQGKLANKSTHEKCNSGRRKSNGTVENFMKIDRTLSKEHQKNYKSLPQKKENQHRSNHYLKNLIKKPKEKKEITPKKSNEPVRNRVENVAELTVHEKCTSNIKIFSIQSSCIPEQLKRNEKTKKTSSNHLKYIQTSKKENNSKKLPGKGLRTSFEDLFSDVINDAGCEKVASDKKSTDKRHSSQVNSEKTHEKRYESSVIMKRPANDEKSALSKKKKLDEERVNQINKKQILPSKTYSDPILPIPTYENILSNMPSYLCQHSSVTANSRYKKTSGNENPRVPDLVNRKKEKEKDRQTYKKAETIKKISLNEYKKRSASERKVDHEDKEKKHVEMHRRPSHADSDLGYDSDSTVKL